MSTKAPIQLRPATQNDVPFIFNSWLKSYRNSHFAKLISNPVYYAEHHKVIENLVSSNQVTVACNPEDSDQVYGYICAGITENVFTIHYIYVKHTYRNMGIAKTLFNSFEHSPDTAGIYTHHTRAIERVAPRYNLIYMPHYAFKKERPHDSKE